VKRKRDGDSKARRSQLRRYGIAVLTVALALMLTLWLNHWVAMTSSPFLMFFGAVMVSAWYGGTNSGLLATALSALISAYFFLDPVYSLDLNLTKSVRLLLFVLQGILISILCGALHNSNQRLKESLVKVQVSTEELRQSEERFSQLAAHIQDVFWILEPQSYQVIYVSPAYEKIWGRSGESLKKNYREWFEAIHALDQERVEAAFFKNVNNGKYDEEYRIVRPDGTIRWIRARGFPVRDEFGETYRIAGIAEDITERHQLEHELRSSEAKFRRLFDANIVGIIFPDLSGNILDANDAFLDMIGYTREELQQGIPWETMTPPEYNLADMRSREELLTTGIATPFEKEYIRKDGTRVPILLVSAMLEGSKQNAVSFVLDLTQQKQAETEIRQFNEILEQRVAERTDQLEAANKELESFSYSVSHDLRAPLRHISGYVELLQKRTATTLDETSVRYVNTIIQTAKHAGTLIDNLLAFSRMGRSEMRYTTFKMNQLLKEVQRDLEPEIKERTILWQIEELPQVQGDPSMLRLVWGNLIENALKYSEPRAIAKIEIGSLDQDAEVVFFIRDNGVGFDMRYVHKLFGVFQRLHSEDQFKGTGIGLANVRRIIHRHNGRTWAEGAVESGATFFFSLPKYQELGDECSKN